MISPETLRRFPFFGGLDHTALKQLAMMSDEVVLGKREWLFAEGDEADAFYLVLQGTVTLRIRFNHESDAHANLTTLGTGDLLGWSAIVPPHHYKLGAIANEGATLARFDGEPLRDLLQTNPDVGYLLMTRLSGVISTRLNNLRVRFVSLALA